MGVGETWATRLKNILKSNHLGEPPVVSERIEFFTPHCEFVFHFAISTEKMSLVVIAAAAVVVFFVILAVIQKRPKGSPPIAHVGLPVIGNYIEFAKHPINFINSCLKQCGPIFTVRILHKNMTFLLGPEVSAPFFRMRDDCMSQPEVYGFMTPVFGKGVVYDAEPVKRNQQYQSMANGLKSNRLKAYIPKIEKECHDYLKNWGESGEINLLSALSELTILTSSRCLHGDDVRENLFADVARLYHDLDHGVTPISFFFPYAPIPAHKKRDHARAEMVKIFSKVIRERREKNIDENNTTDILQIFINMKYKDGSQLTDDQIVGLLIALLFAGQHTSTITSSWTLYYLLQHPRVLNKVMDEQEHIMGSRLGEYSTFDDVQAMDYLQNCVKEVLRMHPPLIMLMRMAMQDIETTCNGKKFLIPKGDIVVTSPQVASRMPEVFSNPNEYYPERFGDDQSEHKVPFAFLGFGGGMHACMGQQFGMLQAKAITSIILRNFELEAVDKVLPDPDYTAMVVGPKNHLMVRYKKRSTSTIPKA